MLLPCSRQMPKDSRAYVPLRASGVDIIPCREIMYSKLPYLKS